MEDGFHLGGEDRLGLAALTHSREMKLYPVCGRPPGLEVSLQPSNLVGCFPFGLSQTWLSTTAEVSCLSPGDREQLVTSLSTSTSVDEKMGSTGAQI